jgi:lysophospholipase L1-like esterase
MKGERAIEGWILSATGLAFLCAGIVVLLAAAVIIRLYLAHRRSPSRSFYLTVAMNLATLLLILVIGEIVVRAGSRYYLDGEAFGKVALVPKSWETTRAHYRDIIQKASGDLSYLVYDDRMGWSIGPNRRSANGLYWSGPDAIRVPQDEVMLAISEEKTSIALVGDSFTFGEEVRYEETWGYHLGELLGEGIQILNLGVPGYGVDQAYLRYERDARRWKPKVAIFGVFKHDLLRTLTIYPFLANPQWDLPFSKPRFMVSDGKSVLLNDPPLRPEFIFAHESIFELPFRALDRGYKESNWQTSFYHSSYLFQMFVSVFPGWSAVSPDFSEKAIVSTNALILKSFAQLAAQEEVVPIVVYFPLRSDLNNRSTSAPAMVTRSMQEAGIAYVDFSLCLLDVNRRDRFLPGGHPTPLANKAIADCLLPFVQQALRQAAVGKEVTMVESLPPTKVLDK